MQVSRFRRRPTADVAADATVSLPTVIDAATFAVLPPEQRACYRPVDPRYERLPVVCTVIYALTLVCVGFYVAMSLSTGFADWFNGAVSTPIRAVLAALTAWIPFSLGEMLVYLLPLALFLVLRHALRRRCDTWRTAVVFVGILGSVAALVFSLFVLTFAAGYRGRTMAEKMELSEDAVTVDELYDTALLLVERINRDTDKITFYTNDFSIMPHTFDELGDKVSEAYDRFCRDTELLPDTITRPKPVLSSEVLSHMGITGMYTFFTGEANINVGFPDYTLPFTVAHEMAHQRGIAREDEANFIAFLVCAGSEDPYVRYSGYLCAYERVANALYRADPDRYLSVAGKLNPEVQWELTAYSAFYRRYEGSTIGDISESINNTYLQSQGTAGVVSYEMVVELIVAFFRE